MNDLVTKSASDARRLALALNDDFSTIETYAKRGHGATVAAGIEAAAATLHQLGQHLDAINAALGRSPVRVIEGR